MMKKIAFIHEVFPGGGAERVTLDIARYLFENNSSYQCYVFTPKIIEGLYSEEIKKIIKVLPVRKNKKRRSEEVEQLINKEGINLLVQTAYPLAGIKGICRRTGCKSVFANHGEPFWERYLIINRRKKSIIYRPLWRFYWKQHFIDKGHARNMAIERARKYYDDCDAYTVLCNDYKLGTCEAFDINPDYSKIHVIENSERVVKEVTFNKEKIIMFCGRLENLSKRLDRLLRIWGKVQHRLPDYRLQIVGDGNYRKNIERQIIQEQLERVDMVGKQSNVEPYYRKASIVCLTSQTEGWPLCMTEAQAYGCIPIAFGCTAGICDILSPSGINGFIVTPFDEDEYAETLIHIATMSEEQQATIRRSAVAKRAEYAPEVIMKKWVSLFDELLERDSLYRYNYQRQI